MPNTAGPYPPPCEELGNADLARFETFRWHELAISESFLTALARGPGLRCAEWERRNPFKPSSIGRRVILTVVK